MKKHSPKAGGFGRVFGGGTWSATFLATALATFAGCGGDGTAPPPPVGDAPGALFYEPPSFCVSGTDQGDSLGVFNFGDTTLVWTTVHRPVGMIGIDDQYELEPQTGVVTTWAWTPAGPFPVVDSLVAETNDPEFLRVVIPIHREDPAGFIDTTPPEAPVLLSPPDGAVVHVNAEFTAEWGRIDDCSGIKNYTLQIATTPAFTNIVFTADTLTTTAVGITPDPTDTGDAHWRVAATDTRGQLGPWSEARSWTVVSR